MEKLRPRLLVVAALVWGPDGLIVQRRPEDANHGGGALELPGGKVELGEAPRQALVRELAEEWGEAAGSLHVGGLAEVLHHVYPPPGPEVVLLVFHVDGAQLSGRLQPLPGASVERYSSSELPVQDFLEADRPFLARVRAGEIRRPPGRRVDPA